MRYWDITPRRLGIPITRRRERRPHFRFSAISKRHVVRGDTCSGLAIHTAVHHTQRMRRIRISGTATRVSGRCCEPHGTWAGLPRNERGFRQKVFWWHPGFDGRVEGRPDLKVTGRRLDGPESFVHPVAGHERASCRFRRMDDAHGHRRSNDGMLGAYGNIPRAIRVVRGVDH